VDDQRRYTGPIAEDAARGLLGGDCTLVRAGAAFELRLVRHYRDDIEVIDSVHGTCATADDALALAPGEWQHATSETTAPATTASVAGHWLARHAGPAEDPGGVLALAFLLGTEVVDVLLLREGDDPQAELAAACSRADAARAAEAVAGRARQLGLARRDRRAATSAASFAAGDYQSVVALLGPEEADLTRAEASRLAMARQRLPTT
jgi:hypothetical protein